MNECTNRSCISLATLGGKCNAFFFFSLIYFWILSCCFQADTPPLCRSAQGHRFYVFIWTLCTKRSCSRLFLLICKRFLRGMLGGPCLSHADSYFCFFFLFSHRAEDAFSRFKWGNPQCWSIFGWGTTQHQKHINSPEDGGGGRCWSTE